MRPPDEKEPAPLGNGDRPSQNQTSAPQSNGSQQVSWWSVREFIMPVLNQANGWPTAGTPAWCSLAHDDPRKWCALLDGAQHWALRMDSCQAAMAEASRDVSAAADWSAVGRSSLRRARAVASGAYIPRRAS
jgi:hypothetical protein